MAPIVRAGGLQCEKLLRCFRHQLLLCRQRHSRLIAEGTSNTLRMLCAKRQHPEIGGPPVNRRKQRSLQPLAARPSFFTIPDQRVIFGGHGDHGEKTDQNYFFSVVFFIFSQLLGYSTPNSKFGNSLSPEFPTFQVSKPSSLPVLSPIDSTLTSSRSSIDRYRFVIGVSFG
jgi:hypothetical protein